MALGRYSRIDNRRSSSNYCSTVTVVIFVALCLVGVWMMTSSSVAPVQNVDDAAQENKNEVKDTPTENNKETTTQTQPFEDNPGDLPDDATKGDTNAGTSQSESSSNVQEEQKEKPEEKPEKPEEKSEEKPEEKSEEKAEEKINDQTNSEDLKKDDVNAGTNPQEEQKEKPEEKTEEKPEEKSDEKFEQKPEDNKFNDETNSGNDQQNDQSKTNEGDAKTEDEGSNNNEGEKSSDSNNGNPSGQENSGENSSEQKSDVSGDQKSDNTENVAQPEESSGEKPDQTEGKAIQSNNTESESPSDGQNGDSQSNNHNSTDVFPTGVHADLLNETTTQSGSFSTQATESKNEKQYQLSAKKQSDFSWKLCNVTAGPDYIPCLDNWQAIKSLPSTKHYEHRERHCPEEPPTCLVSLPQGYKRPIEWPKSREKIWYYNVPHTKLAQVKGHQNWVKVTGEFLTFPGGGTQFKHGALHYIDFIQESVPDIAWGKRSRVVLDVGCGVASFGGFLFDRNVLAMSLAPKDEHEAQVQFALERGIPGISAVMGTKRLPFPARVFDVVHCARCRVPWHIEGGKLLLELNRVLRPGGFFVWSATPVYQKLPEDVEIWKAMGKLTKAMCWEVVSINRDTINKVGVATYRKPATNECYEKRKKQDPPMCTGTDDPNAAWNVPLQACIHKVPVKELERGSQWPEQWPERVQKPPYWLLSSQVGVYGKSAPKDFTADYEHWKTVVNKSYLNGFAAALKDVNVWVMNIVSVDSADTLPIIYERGLFGIYHDWCESFSTYPRSYDLLHADHLFSKVKKRCNVVALVTEVDRILRPEGKLIVRDETSVINELETIFKSMHWEVRMTYSKTNEGLLFVHKTMWRPKEYETLPYAIA
ncbi:hypothetical protein ACFE04_015028 [Oxalis oulophora]